MFVHSGAFHLGFNMWACYNFLPPVSYSRLFEGSPYHTLSFFLSAGVLSGLGQHLSTSFARSVVHYAIPSGGASGALFGVFAAFCMQYPQAEVGIILLPFRFDAQSLLPCVMLFDFLGMVGLYNLGLGHGVSQEAIQMYTANTSQAHLSGALLGVGYSYFDGKNKVWVPLVDFWKRRLKNKSA
jgi:rhomboid-like protein